MAGDSPDDPRRPRAVALALAGAIVVLVTFACFLPALRNGLLAWDDEGYVTHNLHIRSLSLDTVAWAFTEFYCNYWAPLTWLSLAADHAVWGLDPVGYHLTNVVLHALNAGLFLLVAHQLLTWRGAADERGGAPRAGAASPEGALPIATLAALLFALHPLRVESVAWVTERKDVLSVCFGLGAALAYLAHAQARADRARGRGGAAPARAYAASLALYALSLLSKSHLVTLPAVLLVVDAFPLRRFRAEGWRRLVLEKVPYLVLATPVALLTAAAHRPQTKTLAEVDLPTRVIVAARSLLEYLRLFVLPLDVSPISLHPGNVGALRVGHLLPVVAVLALGVAIAAGARRLPGVAATGAICVITLGPVSGLLQNGPQAMAGRFTYVPATALSLLVAAGVGAVHGRLREHPARRRALEAATVAVLLALAAITMRDIAWWRDDLSLWTRSIALNPGVSGRQYFSRALMYQRTGDWQRALADLDEAQAIAARKGYRGGHEIVAARARILRDMGDVGGAEAAFDRAIAAAPLAEARGYLAERAALRP